MGPARAGGKRGRVAGGQTRTAQTRTKKKIKTRTEDGKLKTANQDNTRSRRATRRRDDDREPEDTALAGWDEKSFAHSALSTA